MKKAKMCAVLAVVIGLLGGCSKFSPDETAVSIGKDGEITAAVFDTLDESYYDAEELKKNVEESVVSYNSTAGEDHISIDKFEIKEGAVKLFMQYASFEDYKEFNNVDFYVGDITDAYKNGGYRFETGFQKIEKGKVTDENVTREDIFAGSNHPMMVFDGYMEVEVPGKILYASSNVQVTGSKSAKLADPNAPAETESGKASESESQSEKSTEVMEIAPAQEEKEGSPESSREAALAYIIYE